MLYNLLGYHAKEDTESCRNCRTNLILENAFLHISDESVTGVGARFSSNSSQQPFFVAVPTIERRQFDENGSNIAAKGFAQLVARVGVAVVMIVGILAMVACGGGRPESSADPDVASGTPVEQTSPEAKPEEPSEPEFNSGVVNDIITGTLSVFPDVVIGDALGNSFVNTSWECISSHDGEDVVVFAGEMEYLGKPVMASLQFSRTVGAEASGAQRNAFEIRSISIDDVPQDEFASQFVLYCIVGERPGKLVGNWRSKDKEFEFYPDGTGMLHTSNSERIVWMVHDARLYANVPPANEGWRFDLNDSDPLWGYDPMGYGLRLLCEESDVEMEFTRYQPLEVSQSASQQGGEEWITLTSSWFSVSAPHTWQGNEFIHARTAPGDAEVFGEGNGGIIRMHIFESPLADPYMVIDEFPSREEFTFDDGHMGYVMVHPTGITWFRLDSIGIGMLDGGDISVFTNNEELILRIVRSLV